MKPTTTGDGRAVDDTDATIVRVHGVGQTQPLVDALADIWADAHPEFAAGSEDGHARSVDAFRHQITGHFKHLGFTLTAAYHSGILVGFAYAFPCTAEYWYGEDLLPKIPADAHEGLMGLCELAVRPGWQSQGIGTHLHQRLVQAVSPRWSSLLVRPDNPRGRALYDRLGYTYAGAYQNEPGGQTYDLLLAKVG